MRSHRIAATLVLATVVLAALACAPAPPPAASTEPQPEPVRRPAAATLDTHHARLQGRVTNARRAPLDSVEVVTLRLADPSQGSLSFHRATTDTAGSFSLPVALITRAGSDTATVEVVVRATAFPPRYPRPTATSYYTAETTVAVRVGPVSRAPAVFPVRLVLGLP